MTYDTKKIRELEARATPGVWRKDIRAAESKFCDADLNLAVALRNDCVEMCDFIDAAKKEIDELCKTGEGVILKLQREKGKLLDRAEEAEAEVVDLKARESLAPVLAFAEGTKTELLNTMAKRLEKTEAEVERLHDELDDVRAELATYQDDDYGEHQG